MDMYYEDAKYDFDYEAMRIAAIVDDVADDVLLHDVMDELDEDTFTPEVATVAEAHEFLTLVAA